MYKYLYLTFINKIKEKIPQINNINLFYNQVEECTNYPSILVEFQPINHKYLLNRVFYSEINVVFHLITETQANTRDSENLYFKHLSLIEDIHKTFHNFNKSQSITGLTSDEKYFDFGNLTRKSVEKLNDKLNKIHTKITYKFNLTKNVSKRV